VVSAEPHRCRLGNGPSTE